MKIAFIISIFSLLIIKGDFKHKRSYSIYCPPGVPFVYCYVSPCYGKTCPRDPTARCYPNYCGTCSARWLSSDGTTAQCESSWSSRCPPGVTEYQCYTDPCQGKTCSAYPTARCIPNYCGGCNTEWVLSDGRKVQCSSNWDSRCPPGVTEYECYRDPCQGRTCAADPRARCVANYCGGCNAEWYGSDGRKIQCDNTWNSRCPPGVTEYQCYTDPCQGKTCPADSRARCVSNYCGGCNAEWYGSDGRKIQCNSGWNSQCPPGVTEYQCYTDPCQGKTCPADSRARCVSNYCGGCNAEWYGSDGRKIQCDSGWNSQCPPGVTEVRCYKDPCQGEVCPAYPTAKCFSNYCGQCSFSWKNAYGRVVDCY